MTPPASVEVDTEYDKMRIAKRLCIKGHHRHGQQGQFHHSEQEQGHRSDGPESGIKTADQDDISADNPLRFYIYKEITEPGTYAIRGAVDKVVDGATPKLDSQDLCRILL